MPKITNAPNFIDWIEREVLPTLPPGATNVCITLHFDTIPAGEYSYSVYRTDREWIESEACPPDSPNWIHIPKQRITYNLPDEAPV